MKFNRYTLQSYPVNLYWNVFDDGCPVFFDALSNGRATAVIPTTPVAVTQSQPSIEPISPCSCPLFGEGGDGERFSPCFDYRTLVRILIGFRQSFCTKKFAPLGAISIHQTNAIIAHPLIQLNPMGEQLWHVHQLAEPRQVDLGKVSRCKGANSIAIQQLTNGCVGIIQDV